MTFEEAKKKMYELFTDYQVSGYSVGDFDPEFTGTLEDLEEIFESLEETYLPNESPVEDVETSEQKYYVKLRPEVMYYSDYAFGSIQYLEPYLNDSGEFAPAIDRASFTKSEITRVMDGTLYKQILSGDVLTPDHAYYGSGKEIVDEWTNELIELVPVEDGE